LLSAHRTYPSNQIRGPHHKAERLATLIQNHGQMPFTAMEPAASGRVGRIWAVETANWSRQGRSTWAGCRMFRMAFRLPATCDKSGLKQRVLPKRIICLASPWGRGLNFRGCLHLRTRARTLTAQRRGAVSCAGSNLVGVSLELLVGVPEGLVEGSPDHDIAGRRQGGAHGGVWRDGDEHPGRRAHSGVSPLSVACARLRVEGSIIRARFARCSGSPRESGQIRAAALHAASQPFALF